MNRTRIHWLVGDGLPEHAAMLEAVPGVGNVGKIVVGCPHEEKFGSFSLGDTIPYVLKNAPCSVIVWRDPIGRPDNESDRVGLDGERRSR